MRSNPIVREVAHLLMPAIMLFAVYVQFHGDYGPGGGFQAGIIFASAFILYALVYGLEQTQQALRPRWMIFFMALGVLLYAGVGVVSMLKGGAFLDYNVLAHDPHHGQHRGIMLIELGVGIAVAAVMISIFFSFAGRKR